MNIDLYAYLVLGIFFFGLWIIFYALRPDLRPMMLWASLAGAISGPLSEIWYFKDYWLPPTIVGQGVISPEDVLFGFSVFGVAVAALPTITRTYFTDQYPKHSWLLAAFILSFFAGFLLFTDLLGINSIVAASLTLLLWTTGIVMVRRDLFWLSFKSGLLLTVFSIIIYIPLLEVANDYLRQYWLLWDQPIGITILGGAPLTEVIWYFCLGSSSVFFLYIKGKKLK